MQRAGESRVEVENGPLALDLPRLVRQVAIWASARPIISNVALFGDRIRPGRDTAVLQLAVRYDETRMTEGFDDWIEQLRTSFSELESLLGEKVSVVTPENAAACRHVFRGRDLQALANGKVRVILSIDDHTPTQRDAAAHNHSFHQAKQSSLLAAALDWLSLRSAGAH